MANKTINLLPSEQRRELRLHFLAHSLRVLWMWVLISLVSFLLLTILAKTYLSAQEVDAVSQIDQARLSLKSADNEELKSQVDEINAQVKNIKSLQAQHVYWSKALLELANLLSSDIQLDDISMDRQSGKTEIKGTAGSRDSVLKFWSDMHKSAYFKNINFPLTNLERANSDVFTFTFFANMDELRKE